MSESGLVHSTRSQDVTIATAATGSSTVLCADVAGGLLYVSGVTATATLTLFGSSDGVTYSALYNSDGSQATITVPATGGAMGLPDALYPLRFVRIVSGTELGTAAEAVVSLKS